MSSFHLEFTPEQREKFVCTDITNEFEIRVRQSHSYYDKLVNLIHFKETLRSFKLKLYQLPPNFHGSFFKCLFL